VDLDAGYRAIDTRAGAGRLYSLSCPLMLGLIITANRNTRKAALPGAQEQKRCPAHLEVEALDDPRGSTMN
jgi:5'-nucleotidase / UDP-sugar diphosphatase